MDDLDKTDKKMFAREKILKYQHKPGTKLKLYEVGWTSGRKYYNFIKDEILELKKNQAFLII